MPSAPPVFRPHGKLTETERKREYDKTRGSSAQRGYGSRWQKARSGFLQKHPLCVHCEADDVITAATVVDHKRPHRGDMKLFWDRQNWQPLCERHHNIKTATQDSDFARSR